MTRTPQDPTVSRRAPVAAQGAALPGGPAAPPRAAAGGKTSREASSPTPSPRGTPTSPRRERTAAGMPGPETAAAPSSLRGRAAVRARPETPAGGEHASRKREAATSSSPAGSRGLRGAEWQAAVKAAQSKRRRPASSTAAKPTAAPPLPPVTTGTALTATANCLGHCDWTAGPGDPAEIDKAAERHTTKPPKHPTNTVSVVAEIGGAA